MLSVIIGLPSNLPYWTKKHVSYLIHDCMCLVMLKLLAFMNVWYTWAVLIQIVSWKTKAEKCVTYVKDVGLCKWLFRNIISSWINLLTCEKPLGIQIALGKYFIIHFFDETNQCIIFIILKWLADYCDNWVSYCWIHDNFCIQWMGWKPCCYHNGFNCSTNFKHPISNSYSM